MRAGLQWINWTSPALETSLSSNSCSLLLCFLLEPQASNFSSLLDAAGDASALAVSRPSIVEVEVLAQLAIHQHVGNANQSR